MDSSEPIENVTAGALPLLPPTPHNAVPFCIKEKTARVPMARPGMGSKGKFMKLIANHFRVCVIGGVRLLHYSVSIFYEDGKPVACKGLRRKVINKMKETYDKELNGVDIFYDGDECMFTTKAIRHYHQEFIVVLETILSNRSNGGIDAKPGNPNENDQKRQRRPCPMKSFKVVITGVGPAEISLRLMAKTWLGEDCEKVILRHLAKQSCLLVRQSFFNNDPKNFFEVGSGVLGLRGFHSALQITQRGLSLNLDTSTTMIIQPGPVTEFLIHNQNVKDCFSVDWVKAKRSLKTLRIKVNPSNAEYRITGLSEKPCNEQMFFMKQRGSTDDGEPKMLEVTVYDYFNNHLNIELPYSAELPCINVGKPKRPNYIPLELCSLVSLQRYTKALTTSQRSSLMEKSRQEPRERMDVIINALKTAKYGSHPVLRSCEFYHRSISPELMALKFGNGEEMFSRNGRWSLINKKLVDPRSVEKWFTVNFSARCDVPSLVRDLIKCGENIGMCRFMVFIVSLMSISILRPEFILCLLPEGKNCKIYGPWKNKNLVNFGIATQCMAPTRVDDQILFNVLLKINAKLGGLSSMLVLEHSCSIPIVSEIPTMILGMDVSHGSPCYSDVPSVAAVVSSRQWPLISRYRASFRTQLPRKEVIDSLFKPVGTEDEGMLRELLLDFFSTSGKRKPEQIIVFRDGVSESQFNQVLNIEFEQMIEACKFLDDSWSPKFVVIVVQKNHHTKFFQIDSPDNVPPGTVIDSQVCHLRNNDFYMCSHAGIIGTNRPTHYHVLFDEIGFSADEVQELVHSLCYVYQRSTTAISVVAPVAYAHLAAAQVAKFMNFEEMSELSSSNQGGFTRAVAVPVPQLPKLSDLVADSMFFC